MNDFLGNLVERTLGRIPAIQPRPASLFEPVEPLAGSNIPRLFRDAAEPVEVEEEVETLPRRRENTRPLLRRGLRADQNAETEDSPREDQPSPLAPVFSIKTSTTQSPPEASSRSVAAPPEEKIAPPRQPAPAPTETDRADGTVKNFADLTPRRPEALIQPEVHRADALPQSEEARRERDEEGSNRPSPEAASLAPPLQPVDWLPPAVPTAIAAPPFAPPAPPHLIEREPVIKVTIGRVEVRAVLPSPPAPPAAKAEQTPRIQAMPLDEYLRRRNNGEL